MDTLQIGDLVRHKDGPWDRYGRVIEFVEEEMIRFALVEWSDGSRRAHPEGDLSRVSPP